MLKCRRLVRVVDLPADDLIISYELLSNDVTKRRNGETSAGSRRLQKKCDTVGTQQAAGRFTCHSSSSVSQIVDCTGPGAP